MGVSSFLECSRCSQRHSPHQLINLCACGGPLLVRYDLQALRNSWKKEALQEAESTMWRYEPVLPARLDQAISLMEGWTPLIEAGRLGGKLGVEQLWIKDEGRNPTDSFKARGLCCAVTMAKKLGATKLAIPTAGNAGGALAAYAAAAGMEAHIFMPADVPHANFIESRAFGAHVTLVDGLISDCGRMVAERKEAFGWFEVSTLKEPYRIEGKKTMGYEVAEQFGWRLPDVILYPCGGGVGLIGMWKAFDELEELGWIGPERPRMIAVQASGCAPITRAYDSGTESSEYWQGAHTVASGLRVPKALGDFLVLRAVRESGGIAISINDSEMIDGGLELGSELGIFAAPEGGACVAAVQKLSRNGWIKSNDKVVIFNTGSGYKYLEAYSTRFGKRAEGETDKLGGLITPR